MKSRAKGLVRVFIVTALSAHIFAAFVWAWPPCPPCYWWDSQQNKCVCEIKTLVSDVNFACVGCDVIFNATGDGDSGCWQWSGGEHPSSKIGGGVFATHWHTSGTKTVTVSSPCGGSKSKQVTIVAVASLLPDQGVEFDDGDNDPNTKSFIVCKADSGVVTVTATPTPSVSEGNLPANWSIVGGIYTDSKLFRTVDKTTLAETPIICSCGSSEKRTTIYVVKVQIVEPAETPVTSNNFAFNSATPGVCDVHVIGTTGVSNLNPGLEWTLTAISGSTLTSVPSPPKGSCPVFAYTTLPSSNSQFGEKTLTLTHPLPPAECKQDMHEVEIFFSRDATNNPGGTNPNWYYYWSQTSASTGSHQYNANIGYDGQYTCGDNHFEIGPSAKNQDGGYYVDGDGIDNFGSTCLHEKAHMDYFLTTWGTWANYLSKQQTEDIDQDLLKDSHEPGLGYDPTKKGTPTNQYCTTDDNEDYACKAESGWTNSSCDNQDWSSPGHQWSK
jgi:hypothetical protein